MNTVTQQTPGLANFPFHGETGGAIVNNPAQWTNSPSTNPTGGAVVGVPISTDSVDVTINGQRGFMHNSPNGLTDFQPFNINPTTQQVNEFSAGLQGAGRGVANSVRGAVNSAIELGLQAADFVNASAELLTGNALWKGDLSQTMQGLNGGQIGMGQYYTNLGLNTATFGVYGQAKALYDYGTGKINADQASEQIGGTAIWQLGSAYAMSKAQADASEGVTGEAESADLQCFPAGTLVATSEGLRPIETIQAGDSVWSYDVVESQWRRCAVRRTFVRDYEHLAVRITVAGETIESTFLHPYWVVRGDDLASRPVRDHLPSVPENATAQGRWVDAGDVRIGDEVLLRDGRILAVQGIEHRPFVGKVYNFKVDELECYAVGKAGVLVHNTNGREGTAAEEDPVNDMFGADGVQTPSKTVYNKRGIRIDFENPNPGQRPAQIHVQVGRNKFLFDPETGTFPGVPNSLAKILETSAARAAVVKALRFLGEDQ